MLSRSNSSGQTVRKETIQVTETTNKTVSGQPKGNALPGSTPKKEKSGCCGGGKPSVQHRPVAFDVEEHKVKPEVKSAKEALRNFSRQLEKDTKDVTARIETVVRENDTLHDYNAHHVKTIEQLNLDSERQTTLVVTELRSVQESKKALEESNGKLNQTISRLEEDLKNASENASKYERKQKALEDDLALAKTQLSESKSRASEVEKKHVTNATILSDTNKALESRILSLNNELLQERSLKEQATKSATYLEEQKAQSEKSLQELHVQISALSSERDQLSSRINTISVERDKFSTTARELTQTLEVCNTQIATYELEIRKLKDNLVPIQKEVEKIGQQVNRTLDEVNAETETTVVLVQETSESSTVDKR